MPRLFSAFAVLMNEICEDSHQQPLEAFIDRIHEREQGDRDRVRRWAANAGAGECYRLRGVLIVCNKGRRVKDPTTEEILKTGRENPMPKKSMERIASLSLQKIKERAEANGDKKTLANMPKDISNFAKKLSKKKR